MHVFLIAAMSVDGYIAKDLTAPSTIWTSQEDKLLFTELTERAGVLVMGRKTFETFGRPLKNRKIIVLSSQVKPEKFSHIPDSSLEYRAVTATQLISDLRISGQKELAVCGGGDVYSQFLEAGVVDSLCITIEPLLFGGGISLWHSHLPTRHHFKLTELKQLNENGTLFLKYQVKDVE